MVKSINECEVLADFYFAENDKDKYKRVTNFHKALWSNLDEFDEFVSQMIEEYEEYKGIRTVKQKEQYFNTLKIILCNLVKAYKSGKQFMTISLNKQNYYNPISKYEPIHITYTLFTNLIEWLEKEDFICLYKSSNSPSSEISSMLEPLDALKQIIDEYEFNFTSVMMHPDFVYVQVKNEDKKLIDYEEDEETTVRAKLLTEYNTFLNSKVITINDKEIEKPISVYSVFNEKIGLNGRIFGGAWMNCPSEDRTSIKIDGKSTVEVDIATCSLRMSAHLNGKDIPHRIDLYGIQGIDRDLVKLIANTMLNIEASSSKQGCSYTTNSIFDKLVDKASKQEAKKLWDETKEDKSKEVFTKIMSVSKDIEELKKYGVHYTKKTLREAVDKTYDYFSLFSADWLFKGRGLELQYKDSLVCLEVIRRFLELGKPVLTIHDSFIVKEEDRELLEKAIDDSYCSIIGYHPKLKLE